MTKAQADLLYNELSDENQKKLAQEEADYINNLQSELLLKKNKKMYNTIKEFQDNLPLEVEITQEMINEGKNYLSDSYSCIGAQMLKSLTTLKVNWLCSIGFIDSGDEILYIRSNKDITIISEPTIVTLRVPKSSLYK